MSYAFYCSTNTSSGAPEVYELDLSGFDTSNVEEMDYFVRINSLQKLHLENLQPTKVEYLNGFITN